jgi:thiamine-phosphate pyrophosphorylase
VEDALRGGVRAVQLREKDLPVRELLDMAYRMREITSRYDAKLFINDRVDIAMCVEAEGVHLGRSGIPVHAVRKIVSDKMLIGASTHSEEEALSAEKEGADFITFGPVYHTPSKQTYGEPVGAESLRNVSGKTSVPVFGIGGIKTERIREVMHSGAHGVALISGILGEADIKGAAERYLRMLE